MTKTNRVGLVEGANNLVFRDVDYPKLGKNTVIIRNHSVGVNYIEALHVKGSSPFKKPEGIASGESASEVVEVGENVTDYKVGDKVVSLVGEALAQYSSFEADDRRVAKIPNGISYEEAATIGVQGLTTYALTNISYGLKKGDYALVHAAAGGVGSILVQVIKNLGGIPIASTSSDEKVEFLKELGVEHIINYKKEDVLKKVLDITSGAGVDVAYDSVGLTTFDTSLASLKPLGTLVIYGSASGDPSPFQVSQLLYKSQRLVGSGLWSNLPDKESFQKGFDSIFNSFIKGEFKVKYTTYKFENAFQAFEDIASGKTLGKLLIQIE